MVNPITDHFVLCDLPKYWSRVAAANWDESVAVLPRADADTWFSVFVLIHFQTWCICLLYQGFERFGPGLCIIPNTWLMAKHVTHPFRATLGPFARWNEHIKYFVEFYVFPVNFFKRNCWDNGWRNTFSNNLLLVKTLIDNRAGPRISFGLKYRDTVC